MTAAPSPGTSTRAILLAARELFSERGYAEVGLRQVAARAGVSLALVQKHFGTKAELFEAALRGAQKLESLLGHGREGFGAGAVAKLVASAQDNPMAMLVRAAANPETAAIAARLLSEDVIRDLADWLGDGARRDRAIAITMLCSGFMLYRHMLPLEGSAEDWGAVEETIAGFLQDTVARRADERG